MFSMRRRWPLRQTALNAASLAISMWAGGRMFFVLTGVAPLAIGHAPIGHLVAPVFALASVYFALNSGLTAVVLGLLNRGPAPLRLVAHREPRRCCAILSA